MGVLAVGAASAELWLARRVQRCGLQVSSAGIRVATTFATTVIPWADIERFSVTTQPLCMPMLVVHRRDGTKVRTPWPFTHVQPSFFRVMVRPWDWLLWPFRISPLLTKPVEEIAHDLQRRLDDQPQRGR